MVLMKRNLFARLYRKPLEHDNDDEGSGGAPAGGDAGDRGDSFDPVKAAQGAAERDAGETETALEKVEREALEKAAAKAAGGDAGPGDDPDGEGDETDAAKAAKKARRNPIPLDRHEKILNAERTERERLERELAQYKGAERVAETNGQLTEIDTEILDLEKQYSKLLTDGEHEKASALMTNIRQLERRSTQLRQDAAVAEATARATEATRYDTALERIEEAYPSLNPEHEDFDKSALTEVAMLAKGYQAVGLTPTKALQKAVKLFLGEPETKKQAQALTVTPTVDKEEAKKIEQEATRKAKAVAKAVDTSEKQPPNVVTKVGANSDAAGGAIKAADVMKMKFEDFAKLPDDALARMRGDEV